MSFLQVIILAAVQGLTELFPVSSLGHAVVLPRLLGWTFDEHAPGFLPFLVMLHVGTAAALLGYFWREWIALLLAILGIGSPERISAGRRLFARIAVGTAPAVVIGFVLEKTLRVIFGAPLLAAEMLALNGLVLLGAERPRGRPNGERRLSDLGYVQALFIGVCQAGALVPGFSRSGLTIAAGLGAGLDHADAAEFSFLLAAPIIAGAAVLELPKLLHGSPGIGLGISVLGGGVAGAAALASTAFLMRFFRRHEIEALNPFAYYCLAAGTLACCLLLVKAL